MSSITINPYTFPIDSLGRLLISGGSMLSLYSVNGALIYTIDNDLIDPRGVAVDPDGNFYVADYGSSLGNGEVRKYDSTGNRLDNVITSSFYGACSPIALTWSSTLSALVVTLNIDPSFGGGTPGAIAIMNPNTTDSFIIQQPTGPNYLGIASVLNSSGEQFYASANLNVDDPSAQGFRQIFNSGLNYIGDYAPSINGTLAGLAIKDDGAGLNNDIVFVADTANNSLLKVQGGATTTLVTGLNEPRGVAYVSVFDDVFVANAGNNTFTKYDPSTGNLLGTYTVSTGISYITSRYL